MMNISCEEELCAATVHIASPQKKMQPRITILPRRGSMGRRARMRPNGVNSSILSRHFISRGGEVMGKGQYYYYYYYRYCYYYYYYYYYYYNYYYYY